jgi:beta-ureidopropionase / N-carbamoyl-L-amino-acid hydrolase
MTLPLDRDRLWRRLETLAGFTDPDRPWTRRAFTPLHAAAREWLAGELATAGLTVSLDAGGNLIGRREGTEPGRQPLVSGSHCDTVPEGGRFDGIAGVLAALEVAHALADAGETLRHPLEIIDFLSEEPSDYGVSSVGSRAFAGKLTAAQLALANPAGETLAAAIARAGGNPAALAKPLRKPNSTAAYVELHIEQGRVLESADVPIGVVSSIVGIRRLAITVTGRTDHAGTTPMAERRDALAGAAQVIGAAHDLAARMTGDPDYVVATIGHLSVSPNAANAVPGAVEMILDLRSSSAEVLEDFPQILGATVAPKLAALRCAYAAATLSLAAPTDCAPLVRHAIAKAAHGLGLGVLPLPSGAGHDAVNAALTGPAGMIFIPCRDGRSHCPEEWATPEQLFDGARVLAETLRELDRTL